MENDHQVSPASITEYHSKRHYKSGKIITFPPYSVDPFTIISDEQTVLPLIHFGDFDPLHNMTDEELTLLLEEIANEEEEEPENEAVDERKEDEMDTESETDSWYNLTYSEDLDHF